MPQAVDPIQNLLEGSARALISIAPSLPSYDSLEQVLKDAEAASTRGYFLPDEDERLREKYAQYLSTRAALRSILRDLRPYLVGVRIGTGKQQTEVFTVAFCAACMLVRSAKFLIDSFRKDGVVWRKLDEPAPHYNIPRKQFTAIYRQLTSPRNAMIFRVGVRHFEKHQSEIEAQDPASTVGPIVELLKEEAPFIEWSKSYYAAGRLKYRWHSFLRRNKSGFKNVTFGLFQLSGSIIAELRWKWKRKRVTQGVLRKATRLLEPGDVIVTRHDDAASNLFLPGFWPHGALYIGTDDQRRELGVQTNDERWERSREPVRILEARKDGVLFRELSDTFAVDCFTILRPLLTREQIGEGLTRAIAHEGKGYSFEFDFRRADKLVCTEVIYRAYHGLGPIAFELSTRAGRYCLSAEDILDSAVEQELFEVVAVYGVNGNRFVTGDRAKDVLIESYRNQTNQ